jgi:DNA-binding winged helix-turn-helix (wHTH) protein
MQEHEASRALVFLNARSVVYFGPFRLDLSDGLLTRGDDEVRLPPRALAILRHLVERAGRIVSKQSLMDVAWKDAHVSETSLTEAVGLIRQALGDDPQRPEFIQTVHRRGYRFIAPIATDAPPSPPPVRDESRPRDPGGPADGSTAATPPAREGGRRALAASLAAAALAALGGAWLWVATRPGADEQVVRVNVAFPLEQAPVPSVNAHPIVTLSPDGRRVVYVGGAPDTARLFLREMDRFDAIPLDGTEGAHGPFFSPDGPWIPSSFREHLNGCCGSDAGEARVPLRRAGRARLRGRAGLRAGRHPTSDVRGSLPEFATS